MGRLADRARDLFPDPDVQVEVLATPDPLLPFQGPGLGRGYLPTPGGLTQTGGPVAGSIGTGGSPQAQGTDGIRLRHDVISTGQEDGEFRFILQIDPDDPDGAAGTLRIRVDGVPVAAVPFALPAQ